MHLNLSIKNIIISSIILQKIIYYGFKRSNSNFNGNVVRYSILIYIYIVLLLKGMYMLLNSFTFPFLVNIITILSNILKSNVS